MMAIILLQRIYNLSDEPVVDMWQENTYLQYFFANRLQQCRAIKKSTNSAATQETDNWRYLYGINEQNRHQIFPWKNGKHIIFFEGSTSFHLDRQLFTQQDVDSMMQELQTTGRQYYWTPQ